MSAAFDEALDPLTITTATFTLKQGTTAVPGTVTYSGVTAVFTPASNLAAGTTYTATITAGVKDLAGNLAVTKVWSFTTAAVIRDDGSRSSSSSGSSGGSGVVSSEPYDNIAKFESHDSSLSANRSVTYTFKVPELGVYEIGVTGKESENDIALRVELLKSTSKLVTVQAPGIVYKNLNAWIGTKRMESGLIRFRVENSWLVSNGFAASEIKMVRWDGSKWDQLETTVLRSDSTYTYFEAKTFAFSSLAITGIKAGSAASLTPVGTPAGTPISGTPAATPRPVATPGTEAPPTTLYIIGALLLIGIIAVVVIKRKEIFK